MLKDVQRLLLAALFADDPVTALRKSLADASNLGPGEREWLEGISDDGLLMTGLLVKKLRFERLTRGEENLEKLFEREPKAFMRLYQNYTGAVSPTAYFPQEEAELFRRWQSSKQSY